MQEEFLSLLNELLKFEDVKPVPMQGGGQEQPWLMPIYGYSAEMELIDFLYSFVRLTRPKVVFEAGCHLGLTTWALGRACQENGDGQVISCDICPEYVATTIVRCEDLPVLMYLDSAEKVPYVPEADFAFLDSSYETRLMCLKMMKPGSIAVMHDSRQEPSLRDHPYKSIHFPTWRGFSIIER